MWFFFLVFGWAAAQKSKYPETPGNLPYIYSLCGYIFAVATSDTLGDVNVSAAGAAVVVTCTHRILQNNVNELMQITSLCGGARCLYVCVDFSLEINEM